MMGPRPDASLGTFSVSDVDTSRFSTHAGPLVLERLRSGTWIEVARYGTPSQAAEALDDAIGEGIEPDHLRLRPLNPPPSKRRVLWRRLSWFVGGTIAVTLGIALGWAAPVLVPLGVILFILGCIASFGKGRL